MSREFFNKKAFTWDETSHHDREKLDIIIKNLDLKPGNIILDIGTGTGILIEKLSVPKGNILALDPAENMLYVSRKKHAHVNVSFIQGIAETIPLCSECCHRVICYSVFPHFTEQVRVISEIKRVLKPGGRLVIAHSESREKINNLHRNIDGPVCRDYLPDRDELSSILTGENFKVKNIIDNDEMYCFSAVKH